MKQVLLVIIEILFLLIVAISHIQKRGIEVVSITNKTVKDFIFYKESRVLLVDMGDYQEVWESLPGVFKDVEKAERTIPIDHECFYPLNPSSILSVVLFFKKGVKYIASGEKRCAWHFVKEFETTVRNSIFLPSYFQKKFLKNIRKAKKRFNNI